MGCNAGGNTSEVFGIDRLEDFHHAFTPVGKRLEDRVLDLAVEG